MFVGIAALGVACAARSEIGAPTSDASSASDGSQSSHDGAPADGAHDEDGTTLVDAHGDEKMFADVVEECSPKDGPCKVDSDCCDTFCGFGDRCGMVAPPYGSPSPP